MTEQPARRSAADYLRDALSAAPSTDPTETLEPRLRELLDRYGSAAVHNTLRSLDPCHGYDFTGAGALPQARATDPGTSRDAAEDPRRRMRAAGQVAELLLTFATDPDGGVAEWEGFTAEEACDYVAQVTEGRVRPSWRRVSDLRRLGLVAPTGVVRRTLADLEAEVLAITARGREVAEEILTARADRRKSIRLDVD